MIFKLKNLKKICAGNAGVFLTITALALHLVQLTTFGSTMKISKFVHLESLKVCTT